jgi:hypothetical protein
MRTPRFLYLPALLAVCLLLFLSMQPALAAAKVKKPAPPPDMRKLIQSVDQGSSSVIIVYQETKQTHTYHVDDMTALKVNGTAGKIADIKPGMEVTDYLERDNDNLDGLTLTGYGQQPAAKKTAAKKPVVKPTAASAPSPN